MLSMCLYEFSPAIQFPASLHSTKNMNIRLLGDAKVTIGGSVSMCDFISTVYVTLEGLVCVEQLNERVIYYSALKLYRKYCLIFQVLKYSVNLIYFLK